MPWSTWAMMAMLRSPAMRVLSRPGGGGARVPDPRLLLRQLAGAEGDEVPPGGGDLQERREAPVGLPGEGEPEPRPGLVVHEARGDEPDRPGGRDVGVEETPDVRVEVDGRLVPPLVAVVGEDRQLAGRLLRLALHRREDRVAPAEEDDPGDLGREGEDLPPDPASLVGRPRPGPHQEVELLEGFPRSRGLLGEGRKGDHEGGCQEKGRAPGHLGSSASRSPDERRDYRLPPEPFRPGVRSGGTGMPSSLAHPDAALVRRCLSGDDSAWSELVEKYGRKVYGIAYHLTYDRAEAEELTQDCFLKVWENLDRYVPSEASLLAWIAALSRNLCIDHYRKRRREKGFRFVSDDAVTTLLPGGDDPQADAVRRERLRLLLDAIAELPDELAQVVLLRDLDGLEYREIAEFLDLPDGTVKS
ncbi:RNA polymerase sigma factor, partial [Acidobacteria bacterium ACD]|nr:RNA polymerase sigma factor [Acidobacteria bacterium ACD]